MEEISSVKDGTPTDEELEELGGKIVEDWKKLGRRLDVTDPKLLEIGQAHDQPSERGYYMLKHWKQEKGSAATYQALCGALKHKLVQRQDLAEQFCYINGPFANQLPAAPVPEERVTGEEPSASAGTYGGASGKHQDDSSGVRSDLKRKRLDPNPERGNLSCKIFCASATSRNSEKQDPQEEREKVNRYMAQKIDEVNSQRLFDYSTTIGIRRFCAYLVGELHLMDVNFERSSIKVIVKCRTLEILEDLWRDYCSGHLNVVAEECLISKKVKDELGMETIKLATTILEEDYLTCKLSLMEISAQDVGEEWLPTEYPDQNKMEFVKKDLDDIQPETHSVITGTSDSELESHGAPSVIGEEDISEPPSVATAHTTASTVPQSIATAVAAEAVGVPAAAVEFEHAEELTERLRSILTTKAPRVPATGADVDDKRKVKKSRSSHLFSFTDKASSPSERLDHGTVGVPAAAADADGKGDVEKLIASSLSKRHYYSTVGVSAAAADADDKGDVEKSTSRLLFRLPAKARQTQGSGGPHPPRRPDYGTVGRPIRLRTNLFLLNISPQLSDLYHYDVEITPNKCPRTVKRDVVHEIIRKYKDTTFQGHNPAFDGEKNLYSRIKFPPAELSVKMPGEDGGKDREFAVKIQFAAVVSLLELKNFLSGKQNAKVPQDAVQALDSVMREMPSFYYTPVGRSFFPFDGQGRPLGEGCEVQFGFYSSVRHAEWKAMLVNIDVSAKVFYKSQDAIDYLCETLGQGVTPQSLENRSFRLDKQRLEKAIHGIRVQTTHAGSIKRKYTVWGVSSVPAERLQFDVEDGVTGRKIKTTVAEYFKDTYKLHLRYPHLPCLQVGQKKDRYLPLEVCTIIPCERRYLTEEQIANLIRSTARPAPERQRDIQYWAQEMIRASSKYLNEEFKTSVSTEMVKVDGRVLPAPRLNLGPQDQPLIPRDGSWDMRNKSLHEGARIHTWALACFAPSRWCNDGHLRKFCQQIASVSSGEGMRMTEDPTVVRYAKGYSDVERLFCNWAADLPELQLIMAVLPEKAKHLYSEIKRVGDNVIGIPTQCVQSKLVQQAKPQVCANISLKINSKLGGINHVIDPREKSPVFREPVIIFGADVTHPSPTENGTPSIAAVVASMDSNAAKYCARVRAQRHEKSGGAQEIINDLAVMVKELLIEFYKANRKLKPSKIIFYRDGVSEGQFDQVLVHEVRAIQEACMMLEKDYRPRITFVVVQKRHHTRLFCEDRRDASGKGQNVPPGTTVDSCITHPYEFDFYLCSHFGIQGTSRPAHYHVLYDDNAFTADALQQLTYQLCHLYARCTRSVSIPAPAYYAHLVAFRARHHVTNGGNGSGGDTVDLEKSARAIQVNDRMKGAMYFM